MQKLRLCMVASILPCGFLMAGTIAPGAETNPTQPAVSLTWLGEKPPLVPVGVSWGVPWPRGSMAKNQLLTVHAADGRSIPTQSWPLAFWPDGSVKWSGVAVAADAQLVPPLTVVRGAPSAPASQLKVREEAASIEISTGRLVCKIARTGANLIETLAVDGREVGRNGRLVAVREDRSEYAAGGILREENYSSSIGKVTVEQSGPVRAVVRIEGFHAGGPAARAWLPFTVRLYFTAGLNSIRLVHSFVFDGDAETDFIRGLGVAFTVPFREEKQNRHIRFATEGDGVWAEPVLMSPGYRPNAIRNAIEMNRKQLEGERIPNLAKLGAGEKERFETIAVWDGFKLAQSGPDSFAVSKRTGAASSWLHVGNGLRARGGVFLGDVSGGLAVGVSHFWEKYPSSIEIAGASMAAAELKAWFWSPDAPAMDLRHYDVVGHDGGISYEDHEDGFSTPHGVANTSELTLWAMTETPKNAALSAMAKTANEPPLLVCQPGYYHSVPVFGVWSLPDKSTPEKAALEEQLNRAKQFYKKEIDQRRWYGFWDFGDVMRTYDGLRHQWMYDIGGHAWNNTELIPDAWLWYDFLRTGQTDSFRLAEAMTRNTSEVDVYHLGRFAGLGSRHNVSHWGCGAKEARISEAFLKRFYYYLTTDERTGDLMREVLNVEAKIAEIQPLRKKNLSKDVPMILRIGPDWQAMASNWMTEWERTGDPRYRDYILAGMKSIGAMPKAFTTHLAFGYDLKTKQLFDIGEPNLDAGEFLNLFGGDQIVMELTQLIDCPEFSQAWNLLCEKWAGNQAWKGYTKPRVVVYAAYVAHDQALRDEAWKLLMDSLKNRGHDYFPAASSVIEGSSVAWRVEEIPDMAKFETPGIAQWALNLIMATELVQEFDAAQKPGK